MRLHNANVLSMITNDTVLQRVYVTAMPVTSTTASVTCSGVRRAMGCFLDAAYVLVSELV